MAEPQAEAREPQKAPVSVRPLPRPEPGPSPSPDHRVTSAAPAPENGPATNANPEPLDFGLGAESSDDSPTIISRLNQLGGRPEDRLTASRPFGGSLRGRQLAHFELIEPIGVGGMAAVIRARDKQLDRSVALKILPPEMAANADNIRRFQQEARAAAKLDHENIARVFYCGEDQGLHFISFEFVEGSNLRTVLERRGHIPVPEAIHYLLQIATGLAHAASRGVVHRDIKPSNIIISSNGRAKLVDMGLARSLDPRADHGLTESGVTLGTFDYISPEQALDPHEADARSDIYSLGCTLYHMITGQPPFPEGTAAKKLNQHQYGAPIDPRQLNPEIPDEVALILNRMMAKDPKARYQQPEHLVQHLLQLARKFGAGTEVPDGVLFVDAPLPTPPRLRPLVVAVVACSILAGLVLWHSMEQGGGRDKETRRQGDKETRKEDNSGDRETALAAPGLPVPSAPSPPSSQPPSSAAVRRYEAHTVKDLTDFLKTFSAQDKNLVAEVTLAGNEFDLTLPPAKGEGREAEPGWLPGLLFQGDQHQLTIQGKNDTHPTLRLVYHPDLVDGEEAWSAYTQEGGSVTLRNLRFVVDATEAKVDMAAVKLRKSGQLRLEGCEFVQLRPPSALAANSPATEGRLSSVVVERAGQGEANRPKLILNDCYFGTGQELGQEAVTLEDAAVVHATNCAFAPHAVLFHLRDRGTRETDLRLQHCSAFLAEGTAFHLDDATRGQVRVEQSLFSRPDQKGGREESGPSSFPLSPAPFAVLLHQGGENLGDIRYLGSGNRYHHLSAFWQKTAGTESVPVATTWESFQRELDAANGKDQQSLVLTSSPWTSSNPLQLLRDGFPTKAFLVNVTLPQLRQSGDVRKLVGVERCAWGPLYGTDLPPLEPKPSAVTVKVVEKNNSNSANGIYPTLGQALADAKPGDVILIKHTGLMPVEPIVLESPTFDVTIKPAPGKRPILTLAPTSQVDAPLFRLHDGKLQLDDLEFYLNPNRSEFEAQAVVAVVGAGECKLTNCVATLEKTEKAESVRLALVTVADPKDVMKMDPKPARSNPQVTVDRCLVRGQGDLVAVRASRPFFLTVSNSLVAAGSLLSIDGNPKEPPTTPASQVTLNRVTAYLTEHLVCLRACKEEGKAGKGLVLTQVVSASECLFASVGGKSLIHLDGVDSDEQMKRFFSWDQGTHNAYSNFNPMLDQQPRGEDAMPLMPYDRVKWEIFTKELVGRYERVKFVAAPGSEGQLSRVMPADFRVKTEVGVDPQEYGAVLDKLPRPTLGSGSGN